MEREELERRVAERLKAAMHCGIESPGWTLSGAWLAVAREALAMCERAIGQDRFESMRQVHLLDPIAAEHVLQPDGPVDLSAALGEEPKP